MKKGYEYGIVYLTGAAGYTLVELGWRGYSHWTMALTGGACFAAIYLIESKFKGSPLWKRCLAGSLVITLAELAVGFTVNMLLGWNVWDYSGLVFNLFGQICLLYSSLWFLLCLPLTRLCSLLRRVMRNDG